MPHPIAKPDFPAIYPITDTTISGLSVIEQVRRLVAGGARLIQVREKNVHSRDFFESAAAAVSYAHENGVKIIVNDRVDIALLTGADGVHLGQRDLSPVHARKLLGPKAIIGYSTHTIEQAAEAARLPIDYLAFGPVFDTSTKSDHEPVVGPELLAAIKAAAGTMPIVAIGGIDRQRLPLVLRAGADSAAVISAVLSDAARIEITLASLLKEAEEFHNTVLHG